MILLTGEIKSAQIKKQAVREREREFIHARRYTNAASSIQGHALSFKECLKLKTKKMRLVRTENFFIL